ncbi:MAG: DUF6797 domain-containing protein [Rubripirellula sp.]
MSRAILVGLSSWPLILAVVASTNSLRAETLRQPLALTQQLQSTAPATLAEQAQIRGDAKRGAFVFHTSPAACVNCHQGDGKESPLGPDLAKLGQITDVHVIESLLFPSKSIRKGYETVSVLTTDGELLVGMLVKKNDDAITLRVASDLSHDKTIPIDDVEAVKTSEKSIMPDGLVGSIGDLRNFYDLAKYIMEVAEGGPTRAEELRPSPEELFVEDDTVDLDHAGILSKLKSRDFEAGKSIYHGYCFNCHGNDGNTPSLPTARAFGTQKLRFGADPYRMFLTLSHGNGLMAPMRHLTAKERYQVVHYVREQFMRPTNPDYIKVDTNYLRTLPKGTKDGSEVPNIDRDYGPALASQLRREFSSVLNVDLGAYTIAYNLHSLDQAGLWRGGIDLSDTQHVRDRGEGTVDPLTPDVAELQGWAWGHGGTLDYARESLLPRGPIPSSWMDYRGHHLHGDRVVLNYSIDGRRVFETPQAKKNQVIHSFEIGGGKPLLLAVGRGLEHDDATTGVAVLPWTSVPNELVKSGVASESIAISYVSSADGVQSFTAVRVRGDIDGMRWNCDEKDRLTLRIPEDEETRVIEVQRGYGSDSEALAQWLSSTLPAAPPRSPSKLTRGGKPLWPDVLTTVGYQGLEPDGYALDTLTLPDKTPWNTWFRTSALDFFDDGRMAVATYGGDVWIVSGIDKELRELRWKRFAGGLYEPFGLKIVDGHVFVTCKDRLTKLHDLNADGEADFYESFSADTDVSVNFHAFNFDLQTDAANNFYYSKSGHGGDSAIPGAVIKVSADGKNRELFCTGFRTPNGMGMLPDGRPTASDNQGQWTPASKVNLLRPGGFYGWVQTYSIPGKWEPGGGSIDVTKVVPPTSFDPPLIWMPQEFDNSSGGQLWVDDERWGPLSKHLLHTSFGKGWMSYMMMQEFDDITQAAIIKIPFDFRTGIMRARVNPADGQVYATGLQGWNGGGRIGLLDSGVQRIRYTGRPWKMVSDCQVESDGLRISFNFPLDPDSATNLDSYVAEHWNYHWRREYGSDMYSPITDEPGAARMNVESITLAADGKSVKLNIANVIPVDQAHLILKVKANDGSPFEEEIYWTINGVPQR